MNSRRKAREAALKALYICESRGMSVDEAFAEMAAVDSELAQRAGEPDIDSLKHFALGITGESLEYSRHIAHTIENSRDYLNSLIHPVLKNWELKRIARIDRIILWIALAEMYFDYHDSKKDHDYHDSKKPPLAVIINEAIELARKYSSHKSPGFVNGILDAIFTQQSDSVTE